jgi:uncharacterized protein (DUF1778 family)
MRTATAKKVLADDRIVSRVPHSNRTIIEKAAAVYGATINQFMIQAALDRANQILAQEEQLRLSERDSRLFLDALDNPPAPADALVEALRKHAQLVTC